MHDPELDSAFRRLMAACGEQGAFARVERNRETGELQLVYALRGAAATEFLDSIEGVRPRWARGVLKTFDASRGT